MGTMVNLDKERWRRRGIPAPGAPVARAMENLAQRMNCKSDESVVNRFGKWEKK